MTSYVQGLDVSHWDGDIQWDKVWVDPCAPKFVYMKATEGVSTKDKQYPSYRLAAKQAGLLCGAYHFFAPDTPVADQVDNFVAAVGRVTGELPPMLDVEQAALTLSQSEYVAAITAWLQQVGQRLQCSPGIYTNASFWNAHVGASELFPSTRLWIAHYTQNPAPAMPKGVDTYTFWQYSQSGLVSGIDAVADLNRYPDTLEALHQQLCS